VEQPTRITIFDRQLRCPHCQHELFFERSWQLNTAEMSFFNLDWLNQSAKTMYVPDMDGLSGLQVFQQERRLSRLPLTGIRSASSVDRRFPRAPPPARSAAGLTRDYRALKAD
jgi:hypothetical protein